MFNRYPFDCSRLDRNSSSQPLGFSGDDLLDLFYNVRNFKYTIGTIQDYNPYNDFMSSGGGNGSINDANAALTVVGQNISNNSLYNAGISTRAIRSSASVDLKSFPSVCGEYPVHSVKISNGILEIDFGFVASVGGVYYPTFKLIGAANVTIGSGGYGGGIIIDKFGSILLTDSSSPFPITGTISVNERYDSIEMSKTEAKIGDSVSISPIKGKTFTGFVGVKKVYISDVEITKFSISKSTITFTIPTGAQSDYVTFQGATETFKSPLPLTIQK